MKKNGFTLIELLVVISMVSFLSSIVTSSVNSARDKAEKARASEIMRNYYTAFMIYYSNNGSYPSPSSDAPTMIKCLGSQSGQCGLIDYHDGVRGDYPQWGDQNVQLDAEVSSVYPAMPHFPGVVYAGTASNGIQYKGPTYICNAYSGSRCQNVSLIWYEKGQGNCIGGAEKAEQGLATVCTLTF